MWLCLQRGGKAKVGKIEVIGEGTWIVVLAKKAHTHWHSCKQLLWIAESHLGLAAAGHACFSFALNIHENNCIGVIKQQIFSVGLSKNNSPGFPLQRKHFSDVRVWWHFKSLLGGGRKGLEGRKVRRVICCRSVLVKETIRKVHFWRWAISQTKWFENLWLVQRKLQWSIWCCWVCWCFWWFPVTRIPMRRITWPFKKPS